MIGITSFGAYIPRLRLNRMAIYRAMGWFAPAIIMAAQGERSMCNHDEDSLTMAVAAARDCLIGKDRTSIDGVYLCSTTLPFADRQNAGILGTALNLKQNILTADFTSSLRAGTTGLLAALDAVMAGSRRNVIVAASDKRETKPANFYEMWFGDGAASLLVGTEDVIAEFRGSYSVSYDFADHYRGADRKYDYVWEERWLREEGYAKFIPEAIEGLFSKHNLTMHDVHHLVFPCLFRAEHRAIAKKLGAAPEKLVDNMHEVCGETGAAHALLMFVAALEASRPGDGILLAGFGQGCDALYFQVTENIAALKERMGVKGSLANKQTTDNYMKFLKFRDLIQPDMGIRAEAPHQTAMTTLWRNRKMLTGLIGGKCRTCGTPQFPRMDICVNPECAKMNTQDDYPFADVSARVMTFTGDHLAVSVDPPAIYGMVEFEGGGRFMADFTDCDLKDIQVSMPVRMSFRKRLSDNERGFSGYFWKAVPRIARNKEDVKGEDSQQHAGVDAIFKRMPSAFNPHAAAGLNLIFQFEITGSGGGSWFVTVKDSACRVDEGAAGQATTTIAMAAADFEELMAGRLDGMQAFSSGKLRLSGDIMKAQLIGRLFDFKKRP